MTLRPQALPKVRAQTLRRMAALNLTDGKSPFMMAGDGDLVHLVERRLRAAELYWVSADMTALSMHAGASLATARWATADRPSRSASSSSRAAWARSTSPPASSPLCRPSPGALALTQR